MARTCIGPECSEPAARGDLCWGHAKQRARGQVLRPIVKVPPKERVLDAGSAWLEAEGDAEYRATEARFLLEIERMMLAKGWRPPRAPVLRGRKMAECQLALSLREPGRRRSGAR